MSYKSSTSISTKAFTIQFDLHRHHVYYSQCTIISSHMFVIHSNISIHTPHAIIQTCIISFIFMSLLLDLSLSFQPNTIHITPFHYQILQHMDMYFVICNHLCIMSHAYCIMLTCQFTSYLSYHIYSITQTCVLFIHFSFALSYILYLISSFFASHRHVYFSIILHCTFLYHTFLCIT